MSTTTVGNLSVELGISDVQLRAGLAQAVVASQQAGQKIQQNLNYAASKPGSGGMGGFAQSISRIADDAQYGFRGIVNNMEQLGTSIAMKLGASTEKAMAFGGALTLLAIAANQAIPELEKLSDTRTTFEKMATSAASFAGSINASTQAIRQLATETEGLLKQDNTQGIGAWFQRQLAGLREWNQRNSLRPGEKTLFDQMGLMKTMDEQVQANKDAGRQALRNQLDMAMMRPEQMRKQEAFTAGVSVLDRDINQKTVETSKEAALAFDKAIKGNAAKVNMELNKQLVAEGVQPLEAEQKAFEMMGLAAKGVTSAFEDLSKRLPDLKLDAKLKDIEQQKTIGAEFDRMVKDELERQGLQKQEATIRSNIDSLNSQRYRTEIIGGADAFMRNFSSATSEDPVVKAIDKQTEDLALVLERLKELN